ncbi:MAG: aquaporin [Flavobacteriaceae bacterium]|nr:aquaporin [Flavobacteriaceae bacterium]|tara:strand:+ start:1802 stop:2548 length:747 start_codon:yes stop_codon:yes gene_type:complete
MITNPYIAEFIGTAILLFLGNGIVANVSLNKTKASKQMTPWILITTAWGLAVFTAAFITGQFSGAHLNPAVTLGLAFAGKFSTELICGYIISQLLGGIFGSWLVYIIYIDHYRETSDESSVMGTFCTSPAIRNYKNNFFSELMGTFVLVFGVLYMAKPNIIIEGTSVENFGIGALEALPVGLLVWVIGLSLGGTTGYAINPARDLGPRITYQLLPRKNKISDWAYSWVPVLGPLCGGALAGLLFVFLQ